MSKNKGLESVLGLIPWLLLAILFIALVILFVTNKFDTIGELMRRVIPLPG